MKSSDLRRAGPLLCRGRRLTRSGESQVFAPGYLARARELAHRFTLEADRRLILTAYDLSWNGHLHQRRKQGIAFIEHPLSSAETMMGWGGNAIEVSACLGHDLIEVGRLGGQRVTKAMIAEQLNDRVAAIINGVTELGTEPGALALNPTQAEIWSHYLGEGLKDPAVFKVKLADRFNNMCTLAYTEIRSQLAKAEETLYVYCRIADRLGMWRVKRQMEDICFNYLEPAAAKELAGRREQIVRHSQRDVQTVSYRINHLRKPAGLDFETQMEKRAVWELRERIRRRDLKKIGPADVWRLNIVLKSAGPEDCYRVLSLLQEAFSPFPGEDRDFIVQPLTNGHRFLQTVLTGLPFNLTVQIRDPEMQRAYKFGTLEQDFTWVANLRAALQAPNISDEDLYQLFGRFA